MEKKAIPIATYAGRKPPRTKSDAKRLLTYYSRDLCHRRPPAFSQGQAARKPRISVKTLGAASRTMWPRDLSHAHLSRACGLALLAKIRQHGLNFDAEKPTVWVCR